MTTTTTPATTHKRTDELVPGDRVIPGNGAVRTVASVSPSGYVNSHGQTILTVTYVETPDVWEHLSPNLGRWSSPGNTGAPSSTWRLAL